MGGRLSDVFRTTGEEGTVLGVRLRQLFELSAGLEDGDWEFVKPNGELADRARRRPFFVSKAD